MGSGSHDVLRVESGSLYPALHRLQRQGWIASDWRLSENKQRAKYYRLTAAGRKRLLSEESRWQEFVKAVGALMKPAGEES
ncbi:MAG: helix-turn-helix transcriptional regulator [Terriglobia bacterium]